MDQPPLKLYANKAFVTPKLSYIPLLYPFWGPVVKETTPNEINALTKHGYDVNYFELIGDMSQAEYVLLPHDYWRLKKYEPDLLQKIINEAAEYHKPLLVDASGDVFGKVEIPNARVLRINQYRSELPLYEITVPVPCEDLLESYASNTLTLRSKSQIPTVGFTGWANMPFKQRMRSLLKELPLRVASIFVPRYAIYEKGVFWRERAVQIFKNSPAVKTNFIIRNSYSGHSDTLEGDRKKNRLEFVQNILDSDYTLVVKGDANAATRFYEVLALGRIPVVIDTEMVFPLEDVLNYREFCVFVDYKDIKKAPEILADFHAKLSPEKFINMQRKARDAFEHYLRYDNFSKYLVEILSKPLPKTQ